MADAKAVREWVKIFRDLVITFTAAFMLIYETVEIASPNPIVIGAGLTLLGIPPALRLDAFFRPSGRK